MVKKILLYNSGGGLGDSIQLFPLILGLQKMDKGIIKITWENGQKYA